MVAPAPPFVLLDGRGGGVGGLGGVGGVKDQNSEEWTSQRNFKILCLPRLKERPLGHMPVVGCTNNVPHNHKV